MNSSSVGAVSFEYVAPTELWIYEPIDTTNMPRRWRWGGGDAGQIFRAVQAAVAKIHFVGGVSSNNHG
jgi:hypothetical protein